MRWLVLLLFLPLAGAVEVLEDDVGDVQLSVYNDDVAALPGDAKAAADLTGLRVLEQADGFDIRVGFVRLEDPEDLALVDRYFRLELRHNDVSYAVQASALTYQDWNAFFYEEDPGAFNGFSFVGPVAITHHPETSELGVFLPRDLLLDSKGTPPTEGRLLDAMRVTSQTPYIVSAFASIFPSVATNDTSLIILEDRMGFDEAGTYDVQVGLEQLGNARLRSAEPYRFSNGEASTFVYWLDASNAGDEVSTYSISASGLPQGWTAQVPGGTFQLAPGQDLSFPVILQTAFAHAHGSSESFQVELKAQGSDDRGRIALGIHYPEVPQPAGHHDLLRFWSRDGQDFVLEEASASAHAVIFGNDGTEIAYMNAASEDQHDIGAAVDFTPCGGAAFVNVVTGAGDDHLYCQWIDLGPGLKMGLDFRTDEEGLLEFEVDTAKPMTDVVLTGELLLRRPVLEDLGNGITRTTYEEVVLATIAPTSPQNWNAGDITRFEVPVVPTADSDYVPYELHQGLRLQLLLTSTGANEDRILGMGLEPRLLPGGQMRLPLNEYKDAIQDLPKLGGIAWTAGETDRLANAGRTVVFQAVLANSGGNDAYDVRLLGVNAEWAELIGPDRVALKTNESQEYTVAVRVPKDAVDGDLADLVLEAASRSDLGQRALIQLRAVVDADADVPDEEGQVGTYADGKDSPGAPLALLLAGLAALALRSKRS